MLFVGDGVSTFISMVNLRAKANNYREQALACCAFCKHSNRIEFGIIDFWVCNYGMEKVNLNSRINLKSVSEKKAYIDKYKVDEFGICDKYKWKTNV